LLLAVFCCLLIIIIFYPRQSLFSAHTHTTHNNIANVNVSSRSLKTTRPNFTKYSVRVIRDVTRSWRQWDVLCTSGYVDDVMFIMGATACSTGNIYVSAVQQQVVINFLCIPQVAPHCLTMTWYRMAANCTQGAKSAVYD